VFSKIAIIRCQRKHYSSKPKTFFYLIYWFYTDPDLMKGDGIYSRYFNPMIGGLGVYTFEITVSDSSSNAYTWQHSSHRNIERNPVNSG